MDSSPSTVQTMHKKFCIVQNSLSKVSLPVLTVMITLRGSIKSKQWAKLTQYIRPVKQRFILFQQLKKKKSVCVIFFCFTLKVKDKPLTEELQLKQSQSKRIFFPSYFTSTRKSTTVFLFWSYLKTRQDHRLKRKMSEMWTMRSPTEAQWEVFMTSPDFVADTTSFA